MPHFGELTPQALLNLGFCRIATGTYIGDGMATHSITGLGFRPKVVRIYERVDPQNQGFAMKTDEDGGNTLFFDFLGGQMRFLTDMIISLDADGFTVGDGTGFGNILNVAPLTYTYIAWG